MFDLLISTGDIIPLIAVHIAVFLVMLIFIPLRLRHGRVALRVSLCVAAAVVIEFISITGILEYIAPEANRYFLTIILAILLCWIIFDVPFRHALIAGIDVYFMGQLLLAIIFQLAYRSDLHIAIKVAIIAVSIPFIFLPNWWLLARPMRKDIYSKDTITAYFCVVASIGTVITVILYNMLSASGIYNTIYGYVSFLLWLLINYILTISEYRRQSSEFTRQIQQAMYDEKLKQYQTFTLGTDIINAKCHDLKRYVHELQSGKITSGSEEYIKEIDEALTLYDSITDTGNSDLDVVMSEKKMLCDKDKIILDYVIDASELGFMSGFDIYMMFGNALENAIEACRKEDADKRIITVRVGKKGAMMVINVENYCSAPPDIKDNKLTTCKHDKGYHGFGTVSIQNIAKKYGGNAEFGYSNNYFSLNIILPIKR